MLRTMGEGDGPVFYILPSVVVGSTESCTAVKTGRTTGLMEGMILIWKPKMKITGEDMHVCKGRARECQMLANSTSLRKNAKWQKEKLSSGRWDNLNT